MAYRAERTELGAARDPLVKLWTENLPVGVDPDAKLAWFYRDAPGGPGEAFLLRADDGRAVGCAGLSTRELACDGRVVRAALLADFAIDRGHRSAMPALVLQRAVKRHVDEGGYDLSYGFPNDHAVAIHRRTGYRELGKMARFVRVLRHRGYLQRKFGWARRSQLAGALVDGALVAASAVRALPSAARYALRWEDAFDARWDRLWETTCAASPGYRIACRRSATFLAWRFLRTPAATRPEIAALVERGGDEPLVAFAVVKRGEGGVAQLVDLFGANPTAIDRLLDQLVPALYLRGYVAIEFRYLGHPAMRAILARHWFSFRNVDRTVILSATPTCPIDPAILYDSNAWFMTDLDEDT